MVFPVQCSMLLNLMEHKSVIQHRYSCTRYQLELFLSYKTIVMVFAVQCSMLLNVKEDKNVIEHKYSWSKHQLELVSFI